MKLLRIKLTTFIKDGDEDPFVELSSGDLGDLREKKKEELLREMKDEVRNASKTTVIVFLDRITDIVDYRGVVKPFMPPKTNSGVNTVLGTIIPVAETIEQIEELIKQAEAQ